MNAAAIRKNWRLRLKSLFYVASGGIVSFGAIGLYTGNEKFYTQITAPIIFKILDPETAHRASIFALKYGIFPRSKHAYLEQQSLKVSALGMHFPNPIGVAAGFDKNGETMENIFDLGFSFLEIGSVTPEPQPGNPKPRVFRLIEDEAIINRYGFNSDGHEIVYNRLKKFRESKSTSKSKNFIGVNLGKNKTSPDAASDYIKGIKKFADIADFFIINVSSPNTPGLRDIQKKEELESFIKQVVECWKILPNSRKPPLLLKIAPDLSKHEKQDIASIILEYKEIAGLVINNTTVSRPSDLLSNNKVESGGLSGKPLRNVSTQTIKEFYILTNGKVPIVGVGGVASGEDAYEKIKAGASLVELYTSMVYNGPHIAIRIRRELEELLKRDNFSSVADAIGTAAYE